MPVTSWKVGSATAQAAGGDGNNWSNPDNVLVDDTNSSNCINIGKDEVSDFLRVTGFFTASDIPANNDITGIEMQINRRSTGDSGVTDNEIILRLSDANSGDNMATSTEWPFSTGFVSYGGDGNLWGTTFDRADLLNSTFGTSLQTIRPGSGTSTPNVAVIQFRAYYESASVPINIPATLAALEVDTFDALIGVSHEIAGAIDELEITNNQATVIYAPEIKIFANFDRLEIDAKAGVLSSPVNIEAGIDELEIDEPQAEVFIGPAINANTDNLEILTNIADVQQDTQIFASTDQLEIDAKIADAKVDFIFNPDTVELEIDEEICGINIDKVIDATTAELEIESFTAVVFIPVDVPVFASVAFLEIDDFPSTITAHVDIAGVQDELEIGPKVSAVDITYAIDATTDELEINTAPADVKVNSDISANLYALEIANKNAAFGLDSPIEGVQAQLEIANQKAEIQLGQDIFIDGETDQLEIDTPLSTIGLEMTVSTNPPYELEVDSQLADVIQDTNVISAKDELEVQAQKADVQLGIDTFIDAEVDQLEIDTEIAVVTVDANLIEAETALLELESYPINIGISDDIFANLYELEIESHQALIGQSIIVNAELDELEIQTYQGFVPMLSDSYRVFFSADKLAFELLNLGVPTGTFTSPHTLLDNVEYHVKIVKTPTDIELYINEQFSTSFSVSSDVVSPTNRLLFLSDTTGPTSTFVFSVRMTKNGVTVGSWHNNKLVWKDSSTNEQDGVPVGTFNHTKIPCAKGQKDPFGAEITMPRIPDHIFNFEGTSYIDIGSDTSIQPASAITLAAWIKPLFLPAANSGIINTPSQGGVSGVKLGYDTAGKVEFLVYTALSTPVKILFDDVLDLNKWHFILADWDTTDDVMTGYVNNVTQVDTNIAATAFYGAVDTSAKIGGPTPNNFPGPIGRTYVYNKRLTASERKLLFDSTKGDYGVL